jgi:RNA polymerase sigma factor (sigma-70 family)
VTVLYGAHYRHLTQLATLLVSDVAVADDVVQAAFAALNSAWWRLRDSEKGLSYLRRAVVRRARSCRAADHDRAHRQVGTPQAARPAIGPSEADLLAALRALPARQREALVLRYFADLPDAPIAFAMGIHVRSVNEHIERGLVGLKAALEPAARQTANSPGRRR